MRTGDILENYKRNLLEVDDLSRWAEQLLAQGFESESIYFLLSKPDLHWSELPGYVEQICIENSLCDDFTDPEEAHKAVCIAEFKKGLRSGAELLFGFEELRQSIGFPETLTWRLLEDDEDGSNKSGIYSDQTKKSGEELESYIAEYWQDANL